MRPRETSIVDLVECSLTVLKIFRSYSFSEVGIPKRVQYKYRRSKIRRYGLNTVSVFLIE